MSKKLKFLIPALVLTAMLISGIGFTLSQNSAVSAAAPQGNYQDNGSIVNCDPGNCPVLNGGVCPGGGLSTCPGRLQSTNGARACPCGGLRSGS
jgi:hypothetical protein